MLQNLRSDVAVVGGGLAGIVTALECLRAGKSVTLIDRDTPERLGGLALWAFGGMALVGTKLQARLRIADSPQVALRDWLRFGELAADDVLPRQWAAYYVEHSNTQVYEWLQHHGIRFVPAVNWVERGDFGEGNSVPRYHVVWGTAREMVRRLIAAMREAGSGNRLRLLSGYRVDMLDHAAGAVSGAHAVNDHTGQEVFVSAPAVVLAVGGINGSGESVRAHWPADRPMPLTMLNGAHPFADGSLHRWAEAHLSACLTHTGEMWNYAAGIPHPQPHFPGHGLSLIPCKSALWLDHRGQRIGPQPLVTGFDTHALCQRVAAQEKPYTWSLLNWRIAAREFAISGAEHNPSIRDRRAWQFVQELMLGNHRLVRQMQRESPHFLVDASLAGLALKMNHLTGTDDVHPAVLQHTVETFDANFVQGRRLQNDDQIRRIVHARQWFSDRLRTCRPAPIGQKGAGPFIAIQTQLITRKSLGGLQTDLQCRVMKDNGEPIDGLYGVGEAAGFGGGGASGRRSLEGTFLPGCILTARAAARALVKGGQA